MAGPRCRISRQFERIGEAYPRPMLGRASFVLLVVVWLVGGCAYRASKRASGWLVVETENVRLRTNLARGPAVQLTLEMQRIRNALADNALKCAFEGSSDRFPVTVLPASQYRDFAPEHAAAYYRTASVAWLPDYDAQIIVPDDLGPYSKQVFQHEMTHHLVASCLPGAPMWLHEGLASLLETALVQSGKVTFGRAPFAIVDDARAQPRRVPDKDLNISLMPLHMLPPIRRLIASSSDDWRTHDPIERHGYYASAWALIHFLELGAPDLRPRFMAYLQGLTRLDGDPQALFIKTFEGVPLQERLNAYLKAGVFPWLALRSSDGAVREEDARVREMPEAEGHLHMGWLWSGVPGEEVREPLRQHLASAKQHQGTRADAHVLGAIILGQNQDPAGAEREVVEGTKYAPGDASLLQAHLHLLIERRASTAAVLAAAERLRPIARTADQLCMLANVELGKGDPAAARALAARGLTMKPRSRLCRRVEEMARSQQRPDL